MKCNIINWDIYFKFDIFVWPFHFQGCHVPVIIKLKQLGFSNKFLYGFCEEEGIKLFNFKIKNLPGIEIMGYSI